MSSTCWPAVRVKNFVHMYYKLYMRDGEEAMPIKAPRMTREEGLVFLARRLCTTPAILDTMNPYTTAKALFEPKTILYDTTKRMNSIYKELFGKAHESEDVIALFNTSAIVSSS